MSLLYGGPEDGAFHTDAHRRAMWARHRDELMAWKRPGARPLAWWQYDCPPEVQCQLEDFDQEEAVLWQNGLLSADEKAELEAKWRQGFEAAWRPGFSICTGQIEGRAHWLEGAMARNAHYRWLGIPRPLLRYWKRRRRLRAQRVERETTNAN